MFNMVTRTDKRPKVLPVSDKMADHRGIPMSVLSNNTVDKQNLEDDWDSQVNGEIK
jgi:hypothetical protein